MTPVRAVPSYEQWPAVAALIRRSFAYMKPLLGHPARAAMLSPDDLAQAAANGTAWLMDDDARPVACLFTRPSRDMADALYLGWLAVDDRFRGRGLTRRLFDRAETEARDAGFAALTLETGSPLTDLHQLFGHLGFRLAQEDDEIVVFRKDLASMPR